VLWSLFASTRAGKAAGEVKTEPVSNLSSMALVWLAYAFWGMSCLLFFRAQHESNLHPGFDPLAYERRFYDPSGGGRTYGGSSENGGPYADVAIAVGAGGGPGRGVLCNGSALPEPYPVHGGALWV